MDFHPHPGRWPPPVALPEHQGDRRGEASARAGEGGRHRQLCRMYQGDGGGEASARAGEGGGYVKLCRMHQGDGGGEGSARAGEGGGYVAALPEAPM